MVQAHAPPTVVSYPREWEDEYRRTQTVSLWTTAHGTWFRPPPHSTRAGTLDLFPQYALMHLLFEAEGVQSITWFYLAHVEEAVLDRLNRGEPWTGTKPAANSRNAQSIAECWQTMRRAMGDDEFDLLQEAIVRAGFTRFTGEPDLFCFDPRGGRWFFAEAKGRDELGPKQTNEAGTGWFDIAERTLGPKGRVRVYRVTPQ